MIIVVLIGMGVAPVPILRLFFSVRLGVFVVISVVFDEKLSPGAILVVIPVVIVLVVSIVDANLNAGVLRRGHGQNREWRGDGSGKE